MPEARLLRTSKEYGSIVLSAAFSPDGKTLATGGSNGTIRCWDVSSWSIRQILQGNTKSGFTTPFFLYYLSLRRTKQSLSLCDCFVPRDDGGVVMILNPDLGSGDYIGGGGAS